MLAQPPPRASKTLDLALSSLSFVARAHPYARLRGVTLTRDVPYVLDGDAAHLLDVYRPEAPPRGTVLYVHGGGFRILSKDTHWMMALAFARAGYVVFSTNYRLAPRHPYPAPLLDVLTAWRWVVDHGRLFGGDPSQLVLAGESAGANLVTAAAAARSFEVEAPFRSMAAGLPLRAVVAMCGLLQVERPERFARTSPHPAWMARRIELVCRGYLQGPPAPLASPLTLLEGGLDATTALPPFVASVGERDPIADDTRRLQRALERRGTPHRVTHHPGEGHAFQAVFWRREAKRAWEECFAFLGERARG